MLDFLYFLLNLDHLAMNCKTHVPISHLLLVVVVVVVKVVAVAGVGGVVLHLLLCQRWKHHFFFSACVSVLGRKLKYEWNTMALPKPINKIYIPHEGRKENIRF